MRRNACQYYRAYSKIDLKAFANITKLLAGVFVLASNFVSCRSGISQAEALSLDNTPLQTVNDVFAVRTTNGILEMRMESRLMQHYETNEENYDYFPKGVSVFAYTEDGLLESIIIADNAIHRQPKGKEGADETWEAYGNVVLHNVIKQETMETDTLYWDRTRQEVYTDCYVRMYSPEGFMQGYGMRSDDRMRNARLNRVFNNYVLVDKDTTSVIIDSVNFIGPFQKKIDKFAP